MNIIVKPGYPRVGGTSIFRQLRKLNFPERVVGVYFRQWANKVISHCGYFVLTTTYCGYLVREIFEFVIDNDIYVQVVDRRTKSTLGLRI